MVELSEEQQVTVDGIVDDIRHHQVQTLGGYAGTGKTTVIKELSNILHGYAVVAYTGKAANVLRTKGVTASTIHSLLYKPRVIIDEFGEEQIKWDRQDNLDVRGFIVDESSMVPEEIDADLRSYGLPIIYVGDHGQLEPVNSKFNIMAEPMWTLEKIHRNAGPIAQFANMIREGGEPTDFKSGNGVFVHRRGTVDDSLYSRADQVICAFNATRVRMNNLIRRHLGIDKKLLCNGDRVMCLRNSRDAMLFNGMQGTVSRLSKKKFIFLSNGAEFEVNFDRTQFGLKKPTFDFRQKKHPFDYAYVITAHKAQGDEFGNVVVIEEKCDLWDHRRWAYTAASRARQNLVWICD